MESESISKQKVAFNGLAVSGDKWDPNLEKYYTEIAADDDFVKVSMILEPDGTADTLIDEFFLLLSLDQFGPPKIKADTAVVAAKILSQNKEGGQLREGVPEVLEISLECQSIKSSSDVELLIEMAYFKDISLYFKKACNPSPFSLSALLKSAFFFGICGAIFLFLYTYISGNMEYVDKHSILRQAYDYLAIVSIYSLKGNQWNLGFTGIRDWNGFNRNSGERLARVIRNSTTRARNTLLRKSKKTRSSWPTITALMKEIAMGQLTAKPPEFDAKDLILFKNPA